MEEEVRRINELEKLQLKNEMIINSLAKQIEKLIIVAEENSQLLSELKGITRLITWGLMPLLAIFISMGAYIKNDFDKTNQDQWSRISAAETNISDLKERTTKLEYTIKK